MDLHYSQTKEFVLCWKSCFTTLWIYTILKQVTPMSSTQYSFTTLWIYTILKRGQYHRRGADGFTTLWIYTILKHIKYKGTCQICFTTLWIYTILKRANTLSGSTSSFTTLWIYTILKPQISCAHYTAQGKSTRSSTIVLWRNGIVKGAQIPIQHIEFGAHIYACRCLAL